MLRTYAVLFQNFHRPLSIYSQAAVKISLAPANIFTGRCQYFDEACEILAGPCQYFVGLCEILTGANEILSSLVEILVGLCQYRPIRRPLAIFHSGLRIY